MVIANRDTPDALGMLIFLVMSMTMMAIVGLLNYIAWKRREDARDAYQSSLKALKLDPTNAVLKRKAFDLGMAYMRPGCLLAVPRSGKNCTEAEIINDIRAAGAAAGPPLPDDAAPALVYSIARRLEEIATLYHQGAINLAEHAEQERKILDEL